MELHSIKDTTQKSAATSCGSRVVGVWASAKPVLQLLALMVVAGFAPDALGQTMTPGTVTMVRTGWNADAFAVVTQEPIQNPAGCPTPDGYISDASLPGYKTYYSAALTAFAARAPVVITIHNTECVHQRPKIIGINLTR